MITYDVCAPPLSSLSLDTPGGRRRAGAAAARKWLMEQGGPKRVQRPTRHRLVLNRASAPRATPRWASLSETRACALNIYSAKRSLKRKTSMVEKKQMHHAWAWSARHTPASVRGRAHTQAHSHAHFVQAANVNMSKSVQVRVQYSLDASGAAERGRSAAGQPEGGGDCRGSSASPSSSTRHSSARLQHAWSSGGGAAWLQVRAGRSARPLWRRASRRG